MPLASTGLTWPLTCKSKNIVNSWLPVRSKTKTSLLINLLLVKMKLIVGTLVFYGSYIALFFRANEWLIKNGT